jgi:hypothetical protein
MCKIVEILMLRVLNSVSIEIIFKLSIETEHLMPTAALWHVTRVTRVTSYVTSKGSGSSS